MKKPVGRRSHVSAASARAKAAPRKSAAPRSKKITVDIPQSLLDAAARVVSERHLTTSALVREAMEYYVQEKQARRLERELEEGYLATADLSERVHREFEYVDAEN
jgi:metal-responsive CopG/Arc/MetJ family transcriptional regulator